MGAGLRPEVQDDHTGGCFAMACCSVVLLGSGVLRSYSSLLRNAYHGPVPHYAGGHETIWLWLCRAVGRRRHQAWGREDISEPHPTDDSSPVPGSRSELNPDEFAWTKMKNDSANSARKPFGTWRFNRVAPLLAFMARRGSCGRVFSRPICPGHDSVFIGRLKLNMMCGTSRS